jgi:heat shock protein HslJ
MAVDVMLRMKRLRSLWVVVPVLFGIAAAAVAAEMNFPFDQELLLDTAPMRGSKRVPSIEVRSNGVAAIDLWCATGQGSVRLEGTSISIVPYSMQQPTCPPERMQRDAGMLSALTQITTWRREGDSVVLIGPQVLRYRMSTN